MKWNFYKLFVTLSLAILVGILSGSCAFLFQELIALVNNIFFFGHFSFSFHESLHVPPSIWGVGIVFVPMVGGLLVILLIEKFAADERGLSVPEIIYKIHNNQGKIRPKIALAKTLASAISIGSGASIGREGPVVEIGAAIGSLLSDVISLTDEQRIILVAAGAASATTAIFNAPLAGVAFAIELLLISINGLALLSIAVAVITTLLFKYLFINISPIFTLNSVESFKDNYALLINLLLCVALGVILGIISALFIYLVYWFEDRFNSLMKNPYLRHSIAMIVVGILLYAFMQLFGHYYIEGIGFATIQDCLSSLIMNPWFLLLLIMCKLLATCLSLGSGASGGIFSPALFIGATLGTLFAVTINHIFPHLTINPVLFTMVGMAGVLGSVTGALVTAILITLEMTNNWNVILPIIITTIIAYSVRKQFSNENIYTLKLVRRYSKLN